jgi:hypothetical protein
MLGGLIKKILGGFFPYMFDKNKALESQVENDYELEEVNSYGNNSYGNKGESYQQKSLVKDPNEKISFKVSDKKTVIEKSSEGKNNIEEELVSLFNKNSEINDKELNNKKFNLKSHRNMFYNTNYWEKLKSKLNKTENNKEDIIRSRDARIENKILEHKRIEEQTLQNSKPLTSLEFKQTEKVIYENKNNIVEKSNLYNYRDKDYKENSYTNPKRKNLYTSFDKFYDKKIYDYKNTAKVSSDAIDNGNNIKINDLRAAENIKLVNHNMSNKVDTSLENSIQINDLRKNDVNNNNLVKDANYYVKLGKEIAKNNFNN